DAFEAWMRKRTDVSRKLIKKKHRKMCEGPFPFLRATFYRWIEQWPRVCPRLADRDEDVLLAVGDLHVENFGVWRNSRQRLRLGRERLRRCVRAAVHERPRPPRH